MDANSAFLFGAIIGSIISGAIVGAIPAIVGAVKGRIGLGIGGFFACLGGSLILGLILSVPICAVFMFLIFRQKTTPETPSGKSAEQGSGMDPGSDRE